LTEDEWHWSYKGEMGYVGAVRVSGHAAYPLSALWLASPGEVQELHEFILHKIVVYIKSKILLSSERSLAVKKYKKRGFSALQVYNANKRGLF
jgi:hypothetical protein